MNAVERTKKCVDYYRGLGLCPLPSRMDRKGPALETYAAHYGPTPVPESVYEGWDATNVQIVTGAKSPTPTKIIVVDCDGAEGLAKWNQILSHHGCRVQRSWVSITGSGGQHNYFLLPPDVKECPSGLIWGLWDTWGDKGKGKWASHKEVRILADNALVVAPPSIHVETGKPYQFTGTHNPNRVPLPEVAPRWLLDMPRLSAPKCAPDPPKPRPAPRPMPHSGRFHGREEVLHAVGEHKLSIAKEWGLVTVNDRPNPNGWVNCYVPGREHPRTSKSPSGSFHYHDGTLQDRRDMTSISFFDLGVALGQFSDWRECLDWLGEVFISSHVLTSKN